MVEARVERIADARGEGGSVPTGAAPAGRGNAPAAGRGPTTLESRAPVQYVADPWCSAMCDTQTLQTQCIGETLGESWQTGERYG